MTEEGEHTAAAAAAAQLSSARLFLVVIVVPPFLCFCIIHPSENEMEKSSTPPPTFGRSLAG
jgi:hypothetical protein